MSGAPALDPKRLELAGEFLQEAVFRSRGDQAGATLLAAGSASCGLGAKPAVALDLTARAESIFDELAGGREVDVDAVRAVMSDWIKRQDALDRKRNHFLKDYRTQHGYDRREYTAEQTAGYEAGLDAVNAEVTAGREAAAVELLGRLDGAR
ncbi:MAG: hypothetical protein AAGB93_04455 [Planctomycetota bacterium]